MPIKPTIAYIAQIFPHLTETAVYREVLMLRKMGFNVVTASTHPPQTDHLSEDSKGLIDDTIYVYPINWYRFLTTHSYFLLTRPDKYIGTLLFLMLHSRGEKPRNRWRTFLHFGGAIYLAAHMQRQVVQHVHAHFSFNPATIAFVISRMLDITFSFTAHNICFTDQLLLREKLQAAKFIVSISEYTRDFLLDFLPEEPHLKDKFHVVHCGIPVDRFSPPASKVENQYPVILSLGQLVERKGMHILVEACKILNERGYHFECIIAGDGPQRPLLEQLIANYQLQDKVKLVGAVLQEKILDYLNRADIFALACVTASDGDKDGIPATIMEAMAMEIPAVSTYVSGIPELIDNEQNGLLVKEKDAMAFADALHRLLDDGGLRAKFGRNGRQKVLAEFNLDRSVAQMVNLFEHQA